METLHALFEESHSFMCVIIGPEYRYGFSNRKNRDLLGVTEIVGKTVAEVAPELIEQGFGDLVGEVYASGQPFIGHAVPMHPKGSDRLLYMDFIYQPILGADGGAIGIVAVGHDVTEHREALLAADTAKFTLESSARDLGNENARLRQTLDNLPQMVWLTGADGQPNYFSQYWCEFTGATRREIDEGWADLFHPDDREPAWDLWMHSVQTGEPYQIEYRLRHHSGGYRHVLTRARPERDQAGEVVRWYGTCTDINERVAAEQRILHLQNELVHASRLSAMGSMAATVAHEVNQPLQAMSSYVLGMERMLESALRSVKPRRFCPRSKRCRSERDRSSSDCANWLWAKNPCVL
ncbi:PAS domain-containing protein [Parafrankia sp. BMG5.11]|uniref:PAS domain-containing protein n=1 Tax=Parafrankia sp. BMG5.11 TaxID=222540 RepID=UPI0014049B8A|nr:PAS domain-containing protein [Parafrankia sp. BMG5.11]